MSKKNLLVSFSGGETSAYMAQWLWKNKQDEYNMVFVFANTGQENYETITFSRRCEELFGFKVYYIEAIVPEKMGKGNDFTIVEPWNLDMDGKVFESVIKKHGIPNKAMPSCTREMKKVPIQKFGKWYFKREKYETAIGIRIDEIDRQNKDKSKNRLLYPLISMIPMSKPMINSFWKNQPFRLELKGYQGNCITCWKKSDNKLFQIAKETPYAFNFMGNMEFKYGQFIPETRLRLIESRGELEYVNFPIRFFRRHRSAIDILNESKNWNGEVTDDMQQFDEHNESCEIFSECSDT